MDYTKGQAAGKVMWDVRADFCWGGVWGTEFLDDRLRRHLQCRAWAAKPGCEHG
ncbi:hypothetical protein IMZ48_31770 [Candidatus Bathyarchaeota archaeon]|nr:hypothetical protein [Candidatus Bathyarchaeota archaeon]